VHYRALVVGKRDLRVIEAVVKEKSVYSEKEIYIHSRPDLNKWTRVCPITFGHLKGVIFRSFRTCFRSRFCDFSEVRRAEGPFAPSWPLAPKYG